jgi:hypothetical protein
MPPGMEWMYGLGVGDDPYPGPSGGALDGLRLTPLRLLRPERPAPPRPGPAAAGPQAAPGPFGRPAQGAGAPDSPYPGSERSLYDRLRYALSPLTGENIPDPAGSLSWLEKLPDRPGLPGARAAAGAAPAAPAPAPAPPPPLPPLDPAALGGQFRDFLQGAGVAAQPQLYQASGSGFYLSDPAMAAGANAAAEHARGVFGMNSGLAQAHAQQLARAFDAFSGQLAERGLAARDQARFATELEKQRLQNQGDLEKQRLAGQGQLDVETLRQAGVGNDLAARMVAGGATTDHALASLGRLNEVRQRAGLDNLARRAGLAGGPAAPPGATPAGATPPAAAPARPRGMPSLKDLPSNEAMHAALGLTGGPYLDASGREARGDKLELEKLLDTLAGNPLLQGHAQSMERVARALTERPGGSMPALREELFKKLAYNASRASTLGEGEYGGVKFRTNPGLLSSNFTFGLPKGEESRSPLFLAPGWQAWFPAITQAGREEARARAAAAGAVLRHLQDLQGATR